MSKEEHNEWVIKDNLFHRQVSNVRNTIHGNSEAAMRALELVKAKQQQAALAPLKPTEPGYAQPNYAQLASRQLRRSNSLKPLKPLNLINR